MKASYNWLRTMLPELDVSPEEMGERLTRSGLELEELIEYGPPAEVVVAEVRRLEPHPDEKKDRLRLVTVDRGDGHEQTVVCGAPNVPEPGGKVCLAPVGTTLPAIGLTLTPRKIAGVASEGMLCSEQELGLVGGAGKGDGILVLPEAIAAPAGTPLRQAVESGHDFILDLGVTPNRPDALGHVGLARELAALFDVPFTRVAPEPPVQVAAGDVSERASVVIEDLERCPRYGAAVVLGVKVGLSPLWLRYRLESLGVRAISNVVDVTNLLLLEHGHPTHGFDLAKVDGGRVVVRRARDGEKLTTIDHVERTLSGDDLLIADGSRPIALAGVMGGADSEIGEGSADVLLEVAYFTPRGIRRSARRHGLHSEASHRFERGVDPSGVERVLAHGVALLSSICGGAAVPGTVVAGKPVESRTIVPLRGARMASVLGHTIERGRAQTILERLGFDAEPEGDDALSVTIPPHRPDCSREEDLIEEVMRVDGVDRVPTQHRPVMLQAGRSEPTTALRAREAAAAIGLSEALTFGFVSRAQLEAVGLPPACVELQNPLSEERSVMRTSMLPGLLEALSRAQRHGEGDVRQFAVGRVFLRSESGPLPRERTELAVVLAGERHPGVSKPVPLDIYDLKGVVQELVERVVRRPARVGLLDDRFSVAWLHPRGASGVWVGDRQVGRLGPLHPDVIDRLDLSGAAFVAVLSVDELEAVGRATPQFRPIPALPAATRDLSVVADEAIPSGVIQATMRDAAGELCEEVRLFDLYQGPGVPEGRRSLSYHLVFRDPKATTRPDQARTLTDADVDARMSAVMKTLAEAHGAEVRS